MKRAALLFSLFFITSIISAQTVYLVGVLKDSISNEPVSYASILVLDTKDSAIAGTFSDGKGRFKIEFTEKTSINLKFSSLGYLSKSINIATISKSKLDLGVILLSPESQQLAPVDIGGTAVRIERKFDKTIYKIDEATTAASLTIFDLLRTLPGVTVEGDNTITYKGVSPSIYVDNTPSHLLYPNLLAIPVDRVDKVELIDASMRRGGTGNGGIINIKLKKITDDGFSGVISTKPATTSFKKIDQSNSLINLNYKWKNHLFLNNFDYNTSVDQWNYEINKEFLPSSFFSDSLTYIESGNAYKNSSSVSDCIGYIYQPNEKTRITISMAASLPNQQSVMDVFYEQKNKFSNQLESKYSTTGSDQFSYPSESMGISLYRQLDTAERYLEANLYYSIQNSNTNSDYKETFNTLNFVAIDSVLNYHSTSQQKNNQNVYIDLFYNHPLSDKTRWNLYYSNFTNFNQKSTLRTYVNEIIDPYKIKDDNYSDMQQKLSSRLGITVKKWKFDLGVNFENQNIWGDYRRIDDQLHDSTRAIVKNYFKFLPSGTIGYLINDEQELKLSISLTSQYLSFNELQDFTYKENSLRWRTGNSNLKPTNYYSVYFGYSHSKEKWNGAIDLFYSYTDNYRTNLSYPISSLIWLNKRYNAAKLNKLGGNISLWFMIKKVSISVYSSLYFVKYDLNQLELISQELNIPFTTKSEINFNYFVFSTITYRVKQFSALGRITYFGKQTEYDGSRGASLNVSLSLNYLLLKNKLQLGLGVNNLFNNLTPFNNQSNRAGIITQTVMNGYAYQPSLFLSIRYDLRFGSRNTEYIKGKKQ